MQEVKGHADRWSESDANAHNEYRPALYGRKVLSFVRRSAKAGRARLQRAWDAYSDAYLLDVNAGEGSLDVRKGFVLDEAYIRETWGNGNPLVVEIGSGQSETS